MLEVTTLKGEKRIGSKLRNFIQYPKSDLSIRVNSRWRQSESSSRGDQSTSKGFSHRNRKIHRSGESARESIETTESALLRQIPPKFAFNLIAISSKTKLHSSPDQRKAVSTRNRKVSRITFNSSLIFISRDASTASRAVEAPSTRHGSTSINAGTDRLFIVLIR